jgi:4'-phosphopantetheinyl transferase
MKWVAPPADLDLQRSVHLWRVDLSETDGSEWSAILSPSEAARRDRFLFERERRRYSIARGALRTILGRYLDADPRDISLVENASGKPAVEVSDLQFNVSHSADLALIGVAQHRRIGIDLERERRIGEAIAIAERWFSVTERALIESEREEHRARRFLQCWTAKEAQVKAVGSGVWSLEVADVWRAMSRRHYRIEDPRAAGEWTLQEIEAADEFVAAVVVEGADDWQLETFAPSFRAGSMV